MNRNSEAAILGALIAIGLTLLGVFTFRGIQQAKALDRSVTVKGLAEREQPADIVIWPIRFNEAANDLVALSTNIQKKSALVVDFLKAGGFSDEEITQTAPSIIDRHAQGYGDSDRLAFRYTGSAVITLYSKKVEAARKAMSGLADLGKLGIAVTGEEYGSRPEYLFSGLNEIKPAMIEEATKNAREVAEKFAADSRSRLGKIKTAQQGQFSIEDRDSTTPHIKKIRVVSTVTYYLSD